MENKILKRLLKIQEREITEHQVYLSLARTLTPEKQKILFEIAQQEKNHYETIKKITKKDRAPSKVKIFFYLILVKIFGLNFTLQLMERNESKAIISYQHLMRYDENLEILKNLEDEREHERKLISLIEEKRLTYVSDFILGMNDALVELTGALAGLTLALNNTKIIAMVGLITGIAASLSMGVSNYLASKEEREKEAKTAGIMTGISYILTVFILIFPYLIFNNVVLSLILTLFLSVFIVAVFNFYISVAKRQHFTSRFLTMATMSLSVAVINFVIGFLIKKLFGIET